MKASALDLRLWLARLGLPGLLGLALLGFAAWGEWVDAPKRQARIAGLQSDTTRLRSMKPGELPREERPQAMLAALYGRLQTPDQRSAALSGLLKRAQELGLSVESVQFRAQAERGSGLVRHEIQLPLKGTYPALRDWIARSLQDQPALSLDAVQIRREQAQADPIEARVKATLWVRNEPRTAIARAKPAQHPLLAQRALPATLAEPNAKPREDYVAQPVAGKTGKTGEPAKPAKAAPPPKLAPAAKLQSATAVKQAPQGGPLSRVARIGQGVPQHQAGPAPGTSTAAAPTFSPAPDGSTAAAPALAAASAPAWPPANLPSGMVLRAPPYSPAYASMPTQGRSTLPR